VRKDEINIYTNYVNYINLNNVCVCVCVCVCVSVKKYIKIYKKKII